MCTGSPNAPAPPPAAPQAPTTPAPKEGGSTADRDKRRRAAASGSPGGRGTILTGARGVQDGAATAQKTLLGQ